MPFSSPSAASFIAALISSLVAVVFEVRRRGRPARRSAVGTRMAVPSSLPFSSGSTRPTALRRAGRWSGSCDTAAARARCRSLCRVSQRRLVAGVGMDRRHVAALDPAEPPAGPWRRAPGSWWCRKRWRSPRRRRPVQRLVVDAEDDGLRRRPSAGPKSSPAWRRPSSSAEAFVLAGEDAGAFHAPRRRPGTAPWSGRARPRP